MLFLKHVFSGVTFQKNFIINYFIIITPRISTPQSIVCKSSSSFAHPKIVGGRPLDPHWSIRRSSSSSLLSSPSGAKTHPFALLLLYKRSQQQLSCMMMMMVGGIQHSKSITPAAAAFTNTKLAAACCVPAQNFSILWCVCVVDLCDFSVWITLKDLHRNGEWFFEEAQNCESTGVAMYLQLNFAMDLGSCCLHWK